MKIKLFFLDFIIDNQLKYGMKIFFSNEILNNDTDLSYFIKNYDIVYFPNYSAQFDAVLDYQQKRLNYLNTLFKVENYPMVLGENILTEMSLDLNPSYSHHLVLNKIHAINYADFICKQQIPISTTGYLYFHDVYFHFLGINYIPKSFTQWFSENHQLLNEKEKIALSCVVEWTTLKGQSSIITQMFSKGYYSNLAMFFDPSVISGKDLNDIYTRFESQLKEFQKEWILLK